MDEDVPLARLDEEQPVSVSQDPTDVPEGMVARFVGGDPPLEDEGVGGWVGRRLGPAAASRREEECGEPLQAASRSAAMAASSCASLK